MEDAEAGPWHSVEAMDGVGRGEQCRQGEAQALCDTETKRD